jgi:hypothetical protein
MPTSATGSWTERLSRGLGTDRNRLRHRCVDGDESVIASTLGSGQVGGELYEQAGFGAGESVLDAAADRVSRLYG